VRSSAARSRRGPDGCPEVPGSSAAWFDVRVHRPSAGRIAGGTGVLAVLLAAAVGAAGDSAAVPGLGAATVHPPWDADLGLASGLVTAMLAAACLLGATSVGFGLLAVHRGSAPAPRTVMIAAIGAVLLFTAVPPLGSADHLSYAAYGRIAASGDDPYVVDPLKWRDGSDPVAGAVQPPWQHTRSVYGPVATAAQATVAWLGNGSLRATVWLWQLLAGAAFLLAGFVLDRLTRHDRLARARAAVLWTLNPLLLGQLVLGAHLDVIAVAAAVGAIALIARRPLPAGALLGVAVGSKITFALFGLAILWGLRTCPRPVLLRRLGFSGLGVALVLVPAHLWSGPHTFDQLNEARRMVSLATPWRLVVEHVDPRFGGDLRTVIGRAALVCGVLLAILLVRRLRTVRTTVGTDPDGGTVTMDAARAAVLLGTAWVLTAPYALPWYDSMIWGPLALLAGGAAAAGVLDVILLCRLGLLTLAYLPGRVVGMSAEVERLTLGFRRDTAPWLMLLVLIAVISWACLRPRSPQPPVQRPEAPAPAHSPQ
jgi:hypothetical protein